MEGYDAATYGDRFADIYDDWYDDQYDDVGDLDSCVDRVESLARRAAAARPGASPVVVELGIGTGRLAVPLRDRGLDVRGVDASAAMVERLEAKAGAGAIPVAIGDMAVTDPPGGGPADVVLIASNTFFGLPTDDDQRRCLDRVRAWLAADGRFVVAAFVPDIDAGATAVTVRTLEADRVVLSAARVDEAAQTMSGQYIDITAAGIALRPWHLHYQTPQQIDAMAAASGLVLDERWSSWAGDPFDDASADHVSVYRTA